MCFKCDEKFVPGHKCKKLFWSEAVLDEEVSDGVEVEDLDSSLVVAAISLHALGGSSSSNSMRLPGKI